jgi:biotin operon repressor
MSKNLSTRDALLELRKVVESDAERVARINKLADELDREIAERSKSVAAALSTLEGYVALHTKLHGFSPELESLAAASPSNPVSNLKKSKKKFTRKKKVKKQSSRTAVATGVWPGSLGDIDLSEKEQLFVDILTEAWPGFTSPQELTRRGAIPKANHVTAKVNQLRKKGVPIESAKQARAADPEITTDSKGYRLIG